MRLRHAVELAEDCIDLFPERTIGTRRVRLARGTVSRPCTRRPSTSRYRKSSALKAWFWVDGLTRLLAGEKGKERSDRGTPQQLRIGPMVVEDEASNPSEVRLLGVSTVAVGTDGDANTLEELRQRERGVSLGRRQRQGDHGRRTESCGADIADPAAGAHRWAARGAPRRRGRPGPRAVARRRSVARRRPIICRQAGGVRRSSVRRVDAAGQVRGVAAGRSGSVVDVILPSSARCSSDETACLSSNVILPLM